MRHGNRPEFGKPSGSHPACCEIALTEVWNRRIPEEVPAKACVGELLIERIDNDGALADFDALWESFSYR